MRAFTALSMFVGAALAANSAMAANRYVAADNSIESRLCVSAAMDSNLQFQGEVRDSGISMRSIARSLNCNDEPVATFAANAGNQRNAIRLHRVGGKLGHVEVRSTASASSGAPLTVASRDKVILVKGK